MIYDLLIEPFAAQAYMRNAFAAAVMLAFSCSALGIFLSHKRMTLAGDALSHSLLPGAAAAFMLFGMSVFHMAIGGFIAGMIVALLSHMISRNTNLKEDTSFAGIYIIALALGVIMVYSKGSNEELVHLLFGNIQSADSKGLVLSASIVTITLFTLAVIYRALIMECVDPVFLRSTGSNGSIYNYIFLVLLVMNLVASFSQFGTMMALGMLILPGIITNFWSRNIDHMIPMAIVIAIFGSLFGLLYSYHNSIPAGPSVVVSLGVIYLLSIIFGSRNSIRVKLFPAKHLKK